MKTIVLLACFLLVVNVNGLQRAKIVSGGLYKLQNQNDGRFLTATSNGTPTRSEYGGRADQKFTFTSSKANDEETWTLTPVDQTTSIPTVWKLTPVSHGKTQFRNVATGNCLKAQGGTGEGECNKDDPPQRWYVEYTKAEEKS